MKRKTYTPIWVPVLGACLIWTAGTLAQTNVHIQSTWDGSTNVWTSTSNWLHNPPSLLGYPANGLNPPFGGTNVLRAFETYDVHLPSGRIDSVGVPIRINDLTISGGNHFLWNLTFSNLIISGGTNSFAPLTLSNQFFWTGGDVQSDSLQAFGGIHITGPTSRRFTGTLRSYGNGLVDGPAELAITDQWQHYGTLTLRGNCTLPRYSPFPFFQNIGTLIKEGPGEVAVDRIFKSDGQTHVQSGVLRLVGDAEFLGDVRIDTDAQLIVNAGCLARTNTVIRGPGTVIIDDDYPSSFSGLGGNVLFSNVQVRIHRAGRIGDFSSLSSPKGIVIGSDATVSVLVTSNVLYGPEIGPGVTNSGNIVIDVKGGMKIDLLNKQTIEIRSDCQLAGKVDNRGTIVKTSGSGISSWGYSDFDTTCSFNSGLVWAQQGTLYGPSCGTNTGTFRADAGASNKIQDSVVLAGGTLFIGDGNHQVAGVSVTGSITNRSHLAMYAGGPGTVFNGPEGTLVVGSIYGNVVNQGLIVPNWGLIPFPDSSTHISNLRNDGLVEWSYKTLSGNIQNNGIISKISTNEAFMSAQLTQSGAGAIQVQNGKAYFLNSFTNHGTLAVNSNAAAIVQSNLVLIPGARLEGAGAMIVRGSSANLMNNTALTNPIPTIVDSGTLTVLSNYIVGTTLTLTNAIVTGPADVIVPSNALVSVVNGSNSPGGMWRIHSGGTFDIQGIFGPFEAAILQRDLENEGVLRVAGSVRSDRSIRNRGQAELRGSISGITPGSGFVFLNEGHVVVPAGSSASLNSYWPSTTYFTNRGSFEIQGRFDLSPFMQEGGSANLSNGILVGNLELRGGTLVGSGTNDGFVSLFGTISPGPTFGKIRIADQLFLAPGSSIEFDLGGTNVNSFDRIDVRWLTWCSNGVTFVVRLADGFMPQAGDRFEVMKYGGWIGHPLGSMNLPRFRGLTLPNGLRLAPLLTSTSLVFMATSMPAAGQPSISITRGSMGSFYGVYVQWPPEYVGFIFQRSTNLNFPWHNLRMTDFTTNGLWSESTPEVYYRLLDPEIHE